ncbi:MAG TPA: DUF4147 domain-containing protein [Blastocatellia bacterium]|nr:DUF4147 domain-containing protein [Blastocatellia bacterium]
MKSLSEEAGAIYFEAMREVEVRAAFRKKVKVTDETLTIDSETINLSDFKDIYLVGIGKASLGMGREMEALLEDRLTGGILVCDRRHKIKVRSRVIIAGHPVPDAGSLQAGNELLDLVGSSGPRSLIIFLISGGGSALAEHPLTAELSLEDFKELNRILVHCGASIEEINTIRRRFSKIKGGGLWAEAGAGRGVGLYISDVNVGDLSAIASGPLFYDRESEDRFDSVVEKYGLLEMMPSSMSRLVKSGRLEELTKRRDSSARITHHLLLDNNDVKDAALCAALNKGFVARATRGFEEGDYRLAGDGLLDELVELQRANPSSRVCLVSGGELSCPVTGGGFGGRNQEFVLYCAARIARFNNESNIVVLSCGTDGIDGNSCAAGAMASSATLLESDRNGINYSVYLKTNDSHSFFRKVGGLVATGPTGNNVRDIRIMLSEPRKARIT